MIRVVKKHIGFHYLLIEIVVYFDFFRIEYIPQKLLNKIRDKSITGNIFIMQIYYVWILLYPFHRI